MGERHDLPVEVVALRSGEDHRRLQREDDLPAVMGRRLVQSGGDGLRHVAGGALAQPDIGHGDTDAGEAAARKNRFGNDVRVIGVGSG